MRWNREDYFMAAPEAITAAASAPLRPAKVGVVTVTYNSDHFFDMYMASLEAQTYRPDLVILVDSGSTEHHFLERSGAYSIPVRIVRETNVGVCVGNNIGWRHVRDFDYIFFLNPDAFPAPDFLEKAVDYMDSHREVGMITPSLIRYDMENRRSLDVIDTTGVIRNWHGFPERDQSRPVDALKRYTGPNFIPWLCTAAVLSRREALDAVIEPGDQLFDESFFMYKDDTDLSWRVRRAGWRLVHHPDLLGYHCRGWQSRRAMSRKARLLSVRNELKMCWKNRSPFILVIGVKYLLVRWFDL
jgi:N-acetylglucosaminyl-diphospho-decaprenol L-rhamnosyltransferase